MVGARIKERAGYLTPVATGLTFSDYLETPDDERYELLGGDLLMPPSPNISHQAVQMSLGSLLYFWVMERRLGQVFSSPCDVVLSDSDVVQPDILFISNERRHIITGANVQGAPDLVVEILSPSTSGHDWTTKRELYGRHGVREYWIVDTDERTVTAFLPRDGRLEVVRTFREGDELSSFVLDGFSVDLGKIFEVGLGDQ